jgi:hypothetical protein
MHERLEHFPFPQEEDGDDIILKACGPGQGVSRSIPEKMNPTTELVELFANTTIQHERGSKYVEWENMDTGCVSHKYISHVTIGDAKIVVDGDLSVGTEVDVNSMEAFMQTAPGTVPVSLVLFAWSNEEYEPFNECNQFRFDMGLKETDTSQFLAALFSCTVGVESFLDLYCKDEPNEDKFPIIRGPWNLLNVLVDSDHYIRIDWLGHGRRLSILSARPSLDAAFVTETVVQIAATNRSTAVAATRFFVGIVWRKVTIQSPSAQASSAHYPQSSMWAHNLQFLPIRNRGWTLSCM